MTRPRVQCRKRRYPNQAVADAALAGITAKAANGRTERHEQRVYECPRCHGWHTTSMPKANT